MDLKMNKIKTFLEGILAGAVIFVPALIVYIIKTGGL